MGLKDKTYWEDHYSLELNNFKENGDEGEIWFGRRLNNKIVVWVIDRIRTHFLEMKDNIGIIDIGCGNSQLLITLYKSINNELRNSHSVINFILQGIDFAPSAVKLSSEILKASSLEEKILVKQCDFLQLEQIEPMKQIKKSFEFVIDKGTFDAICLLAGGENSHGLAEAINKYKRSLGSLLKPNNAVFVIASCNNTEDELLRIFDGPMPYGSNDSKKYHLKLIEKLGTPTITFGGKTGSQVACVIFEFVVVNS